MSSYHECFVLTLDERLLCLEAIRVSGYELPHSVDEAIELCASGINGINPVRLGHFECGYSINPLRTSAIFKSMHAPRLPNEAHRYYVVTKYGDDGAPPDLFIASIHKIVEWRPPTMDDDAACIPQFVLKVVNHRTSQLLAVNGVRDACRQVDITRAAARGGQEGEFVAMKGGVCSRTPILIPRVRRDGAGFYQHLFDVLISPTDGDDDVNASIPPATPFPLQYRSLLPFFPPSPTQAFDSL